VKRGTGGRGRGGRDDGTMGSERNGSCLTAVRNTSCCAGASFGFRVSGFRFRVFGLGFVSAQVQHSRPPRQPLSTGDRETARAGNARDAAAQGIAGAGRSGRGAGTGRARTSLISPTHGRRATWCVPMKGTVRNCDILLNIFLRKIHARAPFSHTLEKIGKRIGERIWKKARAARCCARCTPRAALTRRASHADAPRPCAQYHSACTGPGMSPPFSSRF
jgi:hypothetical protein